MVFNLLAASAQLNNWMAGAGKPGAAA